MEVNCRILTSTNELFFLYLTYGRVKYLQAVIQRLHVEKICDDELVRGEICLFVVGFFYRYIYIFFSGMVYLI